MAAAAVGTIADAPGVIAQPKIQWRLSTAYPPVLDQLQGAAQRMAKIVEETSGGGMKRVASRMVVDGNTMAAAVLFTLVMGLLGGLLPALSAMRVKPLESLR